MKHEGWAQATRSELPPGAIERLERYRDLLASKGAELGLVSQADVPKIRERHVMDGLRGADYLPEGCRTVIDLGSGGGVPGIPVAIARPDVEVILAEMRRNRAAFLELVVAELRLDNVWVHLGRAEALDRRVDACLARAFAPPEASWGVARDLLVPGGVLLYWAGERFDATRDAPADVQVLVQQGDPLAYGGPVVIMSPR